MSVAQRADQAARREPTAERAVAGAAGSRRTALTTPPWRRRRKGARTRSRWSVTLAIVWLSVVVLVALLADLLPLEAYSAPVGEPRLGPGFRLDEPFGYDHLGRSVLSRLAYGARVSLLVGAGAVSIAMFVGGMIGLIAGYRRGKVEAVLNVLIDSVLAFPPLFLLLAVTAIYQQSMLTLIGGLGVVVLPAFARLSRASTLSFAQREFVMAARSMGASSLRIMFRELAPNVIRPLASYGFLMLATAVVAEGSLSFLGMGVPPPRPTWGGMIAAGRQYLSTDPHLVFVPAIVLVLTVHSVNIIGDRFRSGASEKGSAFS